MPVTTPTTAQSTAKPWRGPLVMTDDADDWRALVAQIGELEDLLAELDGENDAFSLQAAEQLKQLLTARRRSLETHKTG